jgi:hypothetical protein
VRRTIVVAAGWLAAVAAGAVIGIGALGAIGGSGTDAPLSQQDIANALARPATSAAPAPDTPPASAAATGNRSYFSNAGGTFWASCVGDQVTLSALTPNQGYRIDQKQVGPAPTARVRFKQDVRRGHAAEYEVTVVCAGGVPQGQLRTDD